MNLSTHVLDVAAGLPGAGIVVALSRIDEDAAIPIAGAVTNADGRTDAPLARDLLPGVYELAFAVAPYFKRAGADTCYDTITVRFQIADGAGNYHVPLLLAPWGYTTYRGS